MAENSRNCGHLSRLHRSHPVCIGLCPIFPRTNRSFRTKRLQRNGAEYPLQQRHPPKLVSPSYRYPKKTLPLPNLKATKTALHIKETHIGLGWSSLWNDYPVIEKWVITGADAVLSRTDDGKWNLQDLLHPSHPTSLNRLIIENSSLHMNIAGQTHIIDNFLSKHPQQRG